MNSLLKATLAVLLCGLGTTACEKRDEPGAAMQPGQPAATAGGAATPDSANSADAATADRDSTSVGDPFAGFQLDAGPGVSDVSRQIALRLRNDSEHLAIVFADGGAGEVLLDTVPARAEARVDVVTRARVIGLRSMSATGDVLRSTEVSAGLDTVVEVIVGREASAP